MILKKAVVTLVATAFFVSFSFELAMVTDTGQVAKACAV
jgi:hypothetical protein